MTTARAKLVGVVAGMLLAAAGCNNSKKQMAEKPDTATALTDIKPSGQASQQPESTTAPVDLITRKAQDYSKEMTPLIHARAAAQPPPAPSDVQWIDPSDMRLNAGNAGANEARVSSASPQRPKVQLISDPPTLEKTTDASGNTAIAMAPSQPRREMTDGTVTASQKNAAGALEERLSKRIKDAPRDPAVHLDYQLFQFLNDEPTPQLSILSSLPSEDREVVSVIMDGLTNFRNAMRADSNMLLSKKVKPLVDMSDRLRSQADLTIPTIQFCTRIVSFGAYDVFEPARFPAGVDTEVIVYCEVANFTSNLNDKQLWETRLTLDLTLYAAETGLSVWNEKTQSYVDQAHTRRRDFFVPKKIILPKTLPIGADLLKASIIDKQSNRVSEATIPLVVAAQ